MKHVYSLVLVLLISFMFVNCGGSNSSSSAASPSGASPSGKTTDASSSKDITSFSILGAAGIIGSDSIAVTLPHGTDVTALTPTIATTGASVSPASGVTKDFTYPVLYTVTAADGTTKVYTVTVVTIASVDSKDITAFTIDGQVGDTIFNESAVPNPTITVTMPSGTNVAFLKPTIAFTGISVNPASGIIHNFTNPAVYTVTAFNGTTKTYTVSVIISTTVVAGDAKDITSFIIPFQTGASTINESSIAVKMPSGTNVTHLTPTTIAITGASVSPASGEPQDFTGPVLYTVTASDGTTKVYTVSVTVTPADAKDITAFTIPGQVGDTVFGASTITVTMPYGTNVTALTPTIATTGASVSPASGVAQNFTNPVNYLVTAADGTTKIYAVTVKPIVYNLRDIGPAGGLIFYIDPAGAKLLPSGITYLEAAPSDLAYVTWNNPNHVPPMLTTGVSDTVIGTGFSNTKLIIKAQTTPDGNGNRFAAESCFDLFINGVGNGDWFLPSKDELNKMYVNLRSGVDEHGVTYTPVGGFTSIWYWSSSEYDDAQASKYAAYAQLFDNTGTSSPEDKLTPFPVRAIRSF